MPTANIGGYTMPKPIPQTLLIVDDHHMLRESMVDFLTALYPAVTLLEADSMAAAQHISSTAQPDVVLLDLHLQDVTGFSAISGMRKASPGSYIVVLSGVVDQSLFPQMQELGANAFVSKSGRRDDIADVLNPVLTGQTAQPRPRILAQSSVPAKLQLNTQQLMVLEQLLGGKSNKEIADTAGLSPGTVRNYVSDIFLAFNVHTRSQLMALFH
ncbi:MAG: response regulator transcription factor [Pseudomonadota bacterium]